jgi:hypothetical protein
MVFRRLLILGFLVSILLVAACSEGGEPAATTSNGTNEQPASMVSAEPTETETMESADEEGGQQAIPPREEPNPVNVILEMENGNTVGTLIEPEDGGVLAVTGADGVIYTLSIPPGALLSRESIFMTPLAEIDDLPVGTQWAVGVNLEPEGLVLLEPATLTIEMPEGMDQITAVGFGTYTEGTDFYLKPWEVTGNTIKIQVYHFSAEGAVGLIGPNTGLEILKGLEVGYSPSHSEAWFQQLLARGIAPSNSDAEYADLYEQALKQWFQHSIRSGLKDAETDETVLETLLVDANRWTDWVLTPPDPLTRNEFGARFRAEFRVLWDGLATAFKNAFDSAELACQAGDAHQTVRMVRYFLMVEHMVPKVEEGVHETGYLWGNQGLDQIEVIEQIENCFRFDLTFRSRVEAEYESQAQFLAQTAVSDVDLIWDYEANEIQSVRPLPYEFFEFNVGQGVTCSTSTTPGKVQFELYADFNMNYQVQRVMNNMEVDFVFLSSPQETWDCGRALTTKLWHAHFADVTELVGVPPDLTIELDIVESGSVFAKWEFEGETSLQGYETSSITLEHTPGE